MKREETREERLERRARKRREANEIRERLNRLMKKNRKYGGRRMSVEVPEAAYSAQKFSTETSDDYQTPNKDELKSRIAEAMNVDKDNGRVIKHSAFVTISKMPPLLKWVGLGDGNIETQAFVLRKIKNVHHLTADDVAELPQYYEDPVAVFKDGDNFIVLTNYLADDGNGRMAPVMVYLERTKRGNSYIASIYSLTEKGEAKYANLANGGNLLYVNTEKVAVLPLKDGAKSPITTLVAKGDPNLKTEKGWATAQSEDTIAQNRPGVKFSTERPGDVGMSATVRSVREALRRDGDKAVELLGGTILSNYVREETDAALRKRVARAAVEKLFNVVPVSEERLRQAGLIEETLALPEDEDEVASEYEDAKIVDARNRLAHGGVLVGESQAEAVVRARAKQVLGKTFRYLFEVYHGTPHAGWTRWERGHGGTTGLGYAYFAPRVITAAEYADTYGAPNDGLADVKDMQRYGISEAVYHMVVGMNNPLIVDCRRASWNNIRMKNKRTVRTDEILNVARFGELGYDGVIFLNVHDSQLSVKLHGYDVDVVPLGPVMKSGKNGDVSKQMKSLDGVTVSDVDVPEFFGAIDIRDRFDVRDPDIRWSTEKPGDAARPSFSATAEGRRVVAGILDNLMRFQEDLAFSNPAVEQQRADYGNAAVGKWNRRTREANDKKPGRGERGRAREVYLYLVLSERASLGLKTPVY